MPSSVTRVRRQLQALYGPRYRLHACPRSTCFYCAEPGTVFDHCPPLSWAETFDPKKPNYPPHLLIPACADCNTRLGAKPFFTLYERTQYVLRALQTLYERRAVLWSDEEIEELGDSLKSMVRLKRTQLETLLFRIRNVEKRLLNYESFPD